MQSANVSYVRPDGEVVRSGTTLRQAEHLPSDNEGYVVLSPVKDERPEWVRRAQENRLPVKDYSRS